MIVKQITLILLILLAAALPLVCGESTSVSNVQYFSPSITNQYNAAYSSLQTPNLIQNNKEFFDLSIMIPPGGCQPYVVRSDLLEEQSVPVFCQLSLVQVNPSLDITKLDRIDAKLRDANNYISGIGFHPARAAIRSVNKLVSTPIDSNIGYIVVVLKQIPTENQMPDKITANLSAVIRYNAENNFGIGKSEFYLPVISDEQFLQDYKLYGFLNGLGYLRAESIDATSASLSIYTSKSGRFYNTKLDTGRTSNSIYLPTMMGGQGIQIALDDLKTPETKAKIILDDDEYEVYAGEKFGENCQLRSVISTGGGTGSASITCDGSTFTLNRNFGKIRIQIGTNAPSSVNIGNKLDLSFEEGNEDKIVNLVHYGKIDNEKSYIVVVKSSASKPLSNEAMIILRNQINKAIRTNYAIDAPGIERAVASVSSDAFVIWAGDERDFGGKGVKFAGNEYTNVKLYEQNQDYYESSKEKYLDVIDSFSEEKKGNDTYKFLAMCDEYLLASDLSQNKDARDLLLSLYDSYSEKVCGGKKTVKELLDEQDLLIEEGSKYSDRAKVLNVQLVSVTSPNEEDASVVFNYKNIDSTRKDFVLVKGESMSLTDSLNTKITLSDFNEEKAVISYSCDRKNGGRLQSSNKDVPDKNTLDLEGCSGSLDVVKLNLNKVAKVRVIPKLDGRSNEINISFSIVIEKRAIKLSPEKADERIAELNKTINKWNEINANLGKVVEGMKGACLATSIGLTLKNLFTGFSGKASARSYVMTRDGGWNDWCEGQVGGPKGYTSVDACLSANSAQIEKDVQATANAMKAYNDEESARTANPSNTNKGVLDSDKVRQQELDSLKNTGTVELINEQGEKKYVNVGSSLANADVKQGDVSTSDLRELDVNLKIAKDASASPGAREAAQRKAYLYLNNIEITTADRALTNAAAKRFGVSASDIHVIGDKETVREPYADKKASSLENINYKSKGINDADSVAVVRSPTSSDTYLAVLNKGTGNQYTQRAIYKIGNDRNLIDASNDINAPKNFVFEGYDAKSYHNPCTNCNEAKFYANEPYKGLPSLVPFDKDNGWYAATKPVMPGFGNVKTYQDSGQVNSFYLCNVGANGRIDNLGSDDICRRFDTYTGDTLDSFPGLSKEQAKAKVSEAIRALNDAASKVASNPNKININGMNLAVKGIQATTGGRCSNFMSAKDCQIMFNVCDPVVCPNSRCNFKGQFPVDDVIQSGIIGSIVLCLPNFVGFGGDVYIPVCLTGIHAGIEGWMSILQAHQSCLQESIETNKTTGICDEIYSVYQCDFFWKQIAPFATTITQNLISGALFGKGENGGGEYAFINDAFSNAKNSWQYFTTSYAANSKLAFGARSLTDIGSEFCKMKLSATYPDSFGNILAPESPMQLTAYFDEMTYTDATVPATSQYKVYYHIFAGNDSGGYYSVYLKSSPTALGYTGSPYLQVDSGYVNQGGTIDKTKDFTGVAGFKELCVRYNTKDYCGFKQVSTSFALNYAKDAAVNQQATDLVDSEDECVSGSTGLFFSPNLQASAEEALNPEIYNRGIIRVCSTGNPGKGVEDARWKNVGKCSETLGCWVDTSSLADAITYRGILNDTLTELNKADYEKLLAADYYGVEIGLQEIEKLKANYNKKLVEFNKLAVGDFEDKNKLANEFETYFGSFSEDIEAIMNKLILSEQKAELSLYKAYLYDNITRKIFKELRFYVEPVKVSKATGSGANQGISNVNDLFSLSSEDKIVVRYNDADVGIYMNKVKVPLEQDSNVYCDKDSGNKIIGFYMFSSAGSSVGEIKVGANRNSCGVDIDDYDVELKQDYLGYYLNIGSSGSAVNIEEEKKVFSSFDADEKVKLMYDNADTGLYVINNLDNKILDEALGLYYLNVYYDFSTIGISSNAVDSSDDSIIVGKYYIDSSIVIFDKNIVDFNSKFKAGLLYPFDVNSAYLNHNPYVPLPADIGEIIVKAKEGPKASENVNEGFDNEDFVRYLSMFCLLGDPAKSYKDAVNVPATATTLVGQGIKTAADYTKAQELIKSGQEIFYQSEAGYTLADGAYMKIANIPKSDGKFIYDAIEIYRKDKVFLGYAGRIDATGKIIKFVPGELKAIQAVGKKVVSYDFGLLAKGINVYVKGKGLLISTLDKVSEVGGQIMPEQFKAGVRKLIASDDAVTFAMVKNFLKVGGKIVGIYGWACLASEATMESLRLAGDVMDANAAVENADIAYENFINMQNERANKLKVVIDNLEYEFEKEPIDYCYDKLSLELANINTDYDNVKKEADILKKMYDEYMNNRYDEPSGSMFVDSSKLTSSELGKLFEQMQKFRTASRILGYKIRNFAGHLSQVANGLIDCEKFIDIAPIYDEEQIPIASIASQIRQELVRMRDQGSYRIKKMYLAFDGVARYEANKFYIDPSINSGATFDVYAVHNIKKTNYWWFDTIVGSVSFNNDNPLIFKFDSTNNLFNRDQNSYALPTNWCINEKISKPLEEIDTSNGAVYVLHLYQKCTSASASDTTASTNPVTLPDSEITPANQESSSSSASTPASNSADRSLLNSEPDYAKNPENYYFELRGYSAESKSSKNGQYYQVSKRILGYYTPGVDNKGLILWFYLAKLKSGRIEFLDFVRGDYSWTEEKSGFGYKLISGVLPGTSLYVLSKQGGDWKNVKDYSSAYNNLDLINLNSALEGKKIIWLQFLGKPKKEYYIDTSKLYSSMTESYFVIKESSWWFDGSVGKFYVNNLQPVFDSGDETYFGLASVSLSGNDYVGLIKVVR